jgi:hypothetical protein
MWQWHRRGDSSITAKSLPRPKTSKLEPIDRQSPGLILALAEPK